MRTRSQPSSRKIGQSISRNIGAAINTPMPRRGLRLSEGATTVDGTANALEAPAPTSESGFAVQIEEHFVDVLGSRTRYLAAGAGPALLLLHAAGNNAI